MANPKRYRPIRTVLWGLFLAVAGGFVVLVSSSLIRTMIAERSLARDASIASDRAGCTTELGKLYSAIHQQLDRDRNISDEAAAAAGWAPLRARLLALGERCQFKAKPSDPLARAYQRVVALQRLSESAAVQYRHEVGPTDLEARSLLIAAGAEAR